MIAVFEAGISCFLGKETLIGGVEHLGELDCEHGCIQDSLSRMPVIYSAVGYRLGHDQFPYRLPAVRSERGCRVCDKVSGYKTAFLPVRGRDMPHIDRQFAQPHLFSP